MGTFISGLNTSSNFSDADEFIVDQENETVKMSLAQLKQHTGASVNSIEALKALDTSSTPENSSVNVLGYYEPGDGGGQLFKWKSNEDKEDNAWFRVKPNEVSPEDSGRWVSEVNTEINVLCAGAKPSWYGSNWDNTEWLPDNTPIFQRIFDADVHGDKTIVIPKVGDKVINGVQSEAVYYFYSSVKIPTHKSFTIKGIGQPKLFFKKPGYSPYKVAEVIQDYPDRHNRVSIFELYNNHPNAEDGKRYLTRYQFEGLDFSSRDWNDYRQITPNVHGISSELSDGSYHGINPISINQLRISKCKFKVSHYGIYFPSIMYSASPQIRDCEFAHMAIYMDNKTNLYNTSSAHYHLTSLMEITGCYLQMNQDSFGPGIYIRGGRRARYANNILEGALGFHPDIDINAYNVRDTKFLLIQDVANSGCVLDNIWVETGEGFGDGKRNRLVPQIGVEPMHELGTADVKIWYDGMKDPGNHTQSQEETWVTITDADWGSAVDFIVGETITQTIPGDITVTGKIKFVDIAYRALLIEDITDSVGSDNLFSYGDGYGPIIGQTSEISANTRIKKGTIASETDVLKGAGLRGQNGGPIIVRGLMGFAGHHHFALENDGHWLGRRPSIEFSLGLGYTSSSTIENFVKRIKGAWAVEISGGDGADFERTQFPYDPRIQYKNLGGGAAWLPAVMNKTVYGSKKISSRAAAFNHENTQTSYDLDADCGIYIACHPIYGYNTLIRDSKKAGDYWWWTKAYDEEEGGSYNPVDRFTDYILKTTRVGKLPLYESERDADKSDTYERMIVTAPYLSKILNDPDKQHINVSITACGGEPGLEGRYAPIKEGDSPNNIPVIEINRRLVENTNEYEASFQVHMRDDYFEDHAIPDHLWYQVWDYNVAEYDFAELEGPKYEFTEWLPYGVTTPLEGTYLKGAKWKLEHPHIGHWLCTSQGTSRVINETCDTTNNSNILSNVSNITQLFAGDFIEVNSVVYRILKIDNIANEIEIDKTIVVAATGISIANSAPEWKKIWNSVIIKDEGKPIGIITPSVEGQEYQDTLTGKMYKSIGLSDNDWIVITGLDYRLSSGTPFGVLRPNMFGEEVLDTTNNEWYKSTGTGVFNWNKIEQEVFAIPKSLDYASSLHAYSLRNLSSIPTSFASSGDTDGDTSAAWVVQVRRGDNDLKSFTASEVADNTLLDWVSENVLTYEDDFGNNTTGWSQVRGTLAPNDSPDLSDAASFAPNTEPQNHYMRLATNNVNMTDTYVTEFDLYIPAGQAFNGVGIKDFIGVDIYSKTLSAGEFGTWVSISFSSQYAAYGTPTIYATLNGSTTLTGDDTEKFYVRNFKVTMTGVEGFVSRWYDQSGNDNHAVQATPASQPKIVENSALLTNGIKFDGMDDFLVLQNSIDLIEASYDASIFAAQYNANGALLGSVSNNQSLSFSNSGAYVGDNDTTIDETFTNTTSGDHVHSMIYPGEGFNVSFYKDGTIATQADPEQGDTVGLNAISKIGATGSDGSETDFQSGSLNELIIYDNDKSDMILGIIDIIRANYNI